jgi:hypothetical protein
MTIAFWLWATFKKLSGIGSILLKAFAFFSSQSRVGTRVHKGESTALSSTDRIHSQNFVSPAKITIIFFGPMFYF